MRKQGVVACVPQDSVFEPGQTVRSLLEAALADLPLSEDERKLRIEMGASRAGLREFDVDLGAREN